MRSSLVCLCLLFAACVSGFSQQDSAPPSTSGSAVVPRLIRFTGQVPGTTGIVGITFALHKGQQDNAALWIETQNVQLDGTCRYTVLLGVTKAEGIPTDLFTSGEAQWLGIQVEGKPEQPRVLLVSVPYALRAAEADTLAGHAANEFVTADKLSSAVQQQLQQQETATPAHGQPNANKSANRNSPALAGATNFTDTTTNQVVLVTQNGTGAALSATAGNNYAVSGTSTNIAIYGVSNGATHPAAPALYGVTTSTQGRGIFGYANTSTGYNFGLYGQANSVNGVAIGAVSTATTGPTIGLEVEDNSPGATAAVLQSRGGGKIISGQTGATNTEVFSVDGYGNATAASLTATASYNTYYPAIQAVGYYSSGITATGGTSFGGNGPAGGIFTGGPSGDSKGTYNAGDGVDATGGAASALANFGAGIGVSGYGGNGGTYERGGEGVQGWGGTGSLGGMGGYFIGGYGSNVAGTVGGPGVVAVAGTGNASNGDAGLFYGSGRFFENNLTDVLIGDPGCGVTYAGIGFGVHPVAFTTCLNYAMMGDGTNLFLNRVTGGAIFFRENNTNEMTIAPGGTVSITGNLNVGGKISAGTKDFAIDDPRDPANKYLYHTSVESPDMKTLYDGVAKLDTKGEAWVTLPDYFEALNQDFRYMLTPIGRGAPYLHVSHKVANNRFKIAGGKPNMEVSWQVTGIRHDAFAVANRGPAEVEKPVAERGKYLHPQLFGASAQQAILNSDTPEVSGSDRTQTAAINPR